MHAANESESWLIKPSPVGRIPWLYQLGCVHAGRCKPIPVLGHCGNAATGYAGSQRAGASAQHAARGEQIGPEDDEGQRNLSRPFSVDNLRSLLWLIQESGRD